MTIVLNGKTYSRVLDVDGLVLVIVQQSRMIWRVASPAASVNVLAGFFVAPLRMPA